MTGNSEVGGRAPVSRKFEKMTQESGLPSLNPDRGSLLHETSYVPDNVYRAKYLSVRQNIWGKSPGKLLQLIVGSPEVGVFNSTAKLALAVMKHVRADSRRSMEARIINIYSGKGLSHDMEKGLRTVFTSKLASLTKVPEQFKEVLRKDFGAVMLELASTRSKRLSEKIEFETALELADRVSVFTNEEDPLQQLDRAANNPLDRFFNDYFLERKTRLNALISLPDLIIHAPSESAAAMWIGRMTAISIYKERTSEGVPKPTSASHSEVAADLPEEISARISACVKLLRRASKNDRLLFRNASEEACWIPLTVTDASGYVRCFINYNRGSKSLYSEVSGQYGKHMPQRQQSKCYRFVDIHEMAEREMIKAAQFLESRGRSHANRKEEPSVRTAPKL